MISEIVVCRKSFKLTVIRADGQRHDPEEEGQRQRDAQDDHVGHHLDALFHQDVVLRVHRDRRSELQSRGDHSVCVCVSESVCVCLWMDVVGEATMKHRTEAGRLQGGVDRQRTNTRRATLS